MKRFIFSKQTAIKSLLRSFFSEKRLLFVLACYIVVVASVITWGLPNPSHPFTYHMDEWHQLQAVRATFKYGTPNIPGAAHGSMLHYMLSGVLLVPFYLVGIVNPFMITSSIGSLSMQERLFVVLRANTLLFGALTLVTFYKLVKKYFKGSPFIAISLFTFTPIWLSLSNYFKYDIALLFWIVLSLYFFCRLCTSPTNRNYILAAIPPALAVSTKLSAVPLFLLYLFSYFFFFKKKIRRKKIFFLGLLLFILCFLSVGIPDFLLGKGDYSEFLYSNLVDGPRSNYNLSHLLQPHFYLLTEHFPVLFGHSLYFLFICSLIFWSLRIVFSHFSFSDIFSNKKSLFLFLCGCLFFLSLIPLQLNANGNRALVLLPFIVLLVVITVNTLLSSLKDPLFRKLFLLSIFVLMSVQIVESYNWVEMKRRTSVQVNASDWIVNNLKKGSHIGIENIPIYQMLPDAILNDYYVSLYKNAVPRYRYTVIDYESKVLPEKIIVTNALFAEQNLENTAKNKLLKRMHKEKYTLLKSWSPDFGLYALYGDNVNFYLSGLVASPVDISLYTASKQ